MSIGTSMSTSILTPWEILTAVRNLQKGKKGAYFALYASLWGGIVTDPTFMAVPFDDHMVHRGHAIFDTATLIDGVLYRVDNHLQRFFRSASAAKLKCPFSFEKMKCLILETCAAAKVKNAAVRYWLSSGPGDFGHGIKNCTPSVWILVFDAPVLKNLQVDEVTIPVDLVPMKPDCLAKMKSTNYMLNVLLHLEATERGGSLGIWIDQDKRVGELSVSSLGLIRDRQIVFPEGCVLDSCSMMRVLQLFGKTKEYDPLRMFLAQESCSDASREMKATLATLDNLIDFATQGCVYEEDLLAAEGLFYCNLDINFVDIRSVNRQEIPILEIPALLQKLFMMEATQTSHYTDVVPKLETPKKRVFKL